MLSLGPDKKHRPLRVRCLPVAPLLLPIAANGDTGTSRLKAAVGRTLSVVILQQVLDTPKGSSVLVGVISA
jgi:hypothetical protein